MKQASEIDKILQLKTIWAQMIDNGPTELSDMIEPYEDLLCETFEGCWLQNYWNMPQTEPWEKYELKSLKSDDGRKYYYTLRQAIEDEDGRKEVAKLNWDNFFWELVLSHRLWVSDSNINCDFYFESADLKKILKKIS